MNRGNFKPQRRPSRPERRENEFEKINKAWRCVVGQHAIQEALQVNPRSIQQAWLKAGFESSKELRDLEKQLRSLNVKVETKPEAELERLARSHQGAALFMGYTPKIDWEALYRKPQARLILLDGIEDPHNLGAIIRTAWLMDVDGILVPQDRAVGLTPAVHKVASGGAEHVPVETVANFSNHMESLKKHGFWSYGLSHLGKSSLFTLKFPEKVVWVIGAEDKGLRTTTEKLCDELVHIPQKSAAASYNASVATAIALSETSRQFQLSKET